MADRDREAGTTNVAYGCAPCKDGVLQCVPPGNLYRPEVIGSVMEKRPLVYGHLATDERGGNRYRPPRHIFTLKIPAVHRGGLSPVVTPGGECR